MVCFLIPLGQQFFLGLETLPLVNGVIQFRIGISHLPAVHKELETLHILRIFRFLLGQR